MIRALILDMDNTIYPAASISDVLFKPLYELMDQYKDDIGEKELDDAKQELSKIPFQKIAEKYDFPDELKEKGTEILRDLTYDGPIEAYEDYQYVKPYQLDKHMVTMGFTKMQQCKVDLLKLDEDFQEVVINDPEKTENTKKEVFEDILKKYNYKPEEVLAIGDDPDSEIKAANDLGIPSVLYDREGEYSDDIATYRIKNFSELDKIIKKLF